MRTRSGTLSRKTRSARSAAASGGEARFFSRRHGLREALHAANAAQADGRAVLALPIHVLADSRSDDRSVSALPIHVLADSRSDDTPASAFSTPDRGGIDRGQVNIPGRRSSAGWWPDGRHLGHDVDEWASVYLNWTAGPGCAGMGSTSYFPFALELRRQLFFCIYPQRPITALIVAAIKQRFISF